MPGHGDADDAICTSTVPNASVLRPENVRNPEWSANTSSARGQYPHSDLTLTGDPLHLWMEDHGSESRPTGQLIQEDPTIDCHVIWTMEDTQRALRLPNALYHK